MKVYAKGVWNKLGVGTVQQEGKTISLPRGESCTLELYTTDDAGIVPDLQLATFEFRLINPLMPRNVIYRVSATGSTADQLRNGHATFQIALPGSVDAVLSASGVCAVYGLGARPSALRAASVWTISFRCIWAVPIHLRTW